ncbi:MAG TPA: alpha/beta hydrolase [Actinomycetota bacterium]|nr:alpha/beta hydrolase [Actinomycetota bacterium]
MIGTFPHALTMRSIVAAVAAFAVALAACSSQPSGPTPGVPTPTGAASASTDRTGSFDVGDHRLSMECEGDGSPTIVFLHGVGGQSADWSATLEGLSGVATCNYDRLNAGASDRDPERHTVTDSVADLGSLLDVAGVDPPYLLVAHSFGGMIALLYAADHPEEISGILLVDATMPFEAELDPPELVDRIAADLDDNPEHIDFYDAYAVAADVVDRLPPVPITYLFGTLQELPPEWEPGAYEEALHAYMRGLPEGRLVEEESGHGMPLEIPDEIASQIMAMLDRIGS